MLRGGAGHHDAQMWKLHSCAIINWGVDVRDLSLSLIKVIKMFIFVNVPMAVIYHIDDIVDSSKKREDNKTQKPSGKI